MEQILINENRSAVADFQRMIESVITRTQKLIDTFHKYQSWTKIRSDEDLHKLLSDPSGYFDQVILSNIELKSTGNLTPNVGVVADMFNVRRDDFLDQVRQSISLNEYKRYQDYITLNDGILSVNEDKVQDKKLSFRVFATNKNQIETYNYWTNVCTVFNSLKERGFLGSEMINTIQKSLENRILFSYGDNRFHLDESILMNEILKLKS